MEKYTSKLLEEYMEVNNELVRNQRELLKKQRKLVQSHWESSERCKLVFESQPDSILILNDQIPPQIIDCNPATEHIFGYSRDELLGIQTDKLHLNSENREKFPTIKVIYMSGYGGEMVSSRNIVDDDVPFLQKPFSNAELIDTIAEVLNR